MTNATRKPVKNSSSSVQSAKFRQAARELGADSTEEQFKAIVRKVASAPPAKNASHPKPKSK